MRAVLPETALTGSVRPPVQTTFRLHEFEQSKLELRVRNSFFDGVPGGRSPVVVALRSMEALVADMSMVGQSYLTLGGWRQVLEHQVPPHSEDVLSFLFSYEAEDRVKGEERANQQGDWVGGLRTRPSSQSRRATVRRSSRTSRTSWGRVFVTRYEAVWFRGVLPEGVGLCFLGGLAQTFLGPRGKCSQAQQYNSDTCASSSLTLLSTAMAMASKYVTPCAVLLHSVEHWAATTPLPACCSQLLLQRLLCCATATHRLGSSWMLA
jgi:hypothetical protein